MYVCASRASVSVCMCLCVSVCNIIIIIIIIIKSCCQHDYLWLSLATSPYHSLPLAGLQGYILCPHIAAVCRPAFAWPYVGIHRSTSLMSSSLLLQQCPACLVRLTCIVFVMGGKWPYSWCLVNRNENIMNMHVCICVCIHIWMCICVHNSWVLACLYVFFVCECECVCQSKCVCVFVWNNCFV